MARPGVSLGRAMAYGRVRLHPRRARVSAVLRDFRSATRVMVKLSKDKAPCRACSVLYCGVYTLKKLPARFRGAFSRNSY